MPFNMSTGTRSSVLDKLRLDFLNGAIALYDGVQPASADNPATGTLLGYVSKGGATFTPGDATNGIDLIADPSDAAALIKNTAETWRIVAIAAGTARYARYVTNAVDNNSDSTTLKRMDITVGVLTGNLRLTTVVFQNVGDIADITFCRIKLKSTQTP